MTPEYPGRKAGPRAIKRPLIRLPAHPKLHSGAERFLSTNEPNLQGLVGLARQNAARSTATFSCAAVRLHSLYKVRIRVSRDSKNRSSVQFRATRRQLALNFLRIAWEIPLATDRLTQTHLTATRMRRCESSLGYRQPYRRRPFHGVPGRTSRNGYARVSSKRLLK